MDVAPLDRAYREGRTIRELGVEYNLPSTAVYQLLRWYGTPLRPKHRSSAAEAAQHRARHDKASFIDDFYNGYTATEIAAARGFRVREVVAALWAEGIAASAKEDLSDVHYMWRGGYCTVEEIAQVLNVDVMRVESRVERFLRSMEVLKEHRPP